MIKIAVYDAQGRILRVGKAPVEELEIVDYEGEYKMEVHGDVLDITHYISNGEVLPRPTMDLVVTQNPFTITNIPANTEVSYPGGTVIVDDGYLEWDATVPGEYPFYLTNFPYQEERVYAEISDV